MNNRVFEINENFELELRRNNEQISIDEPVFILRASDTQALSTIRVYQSTMAPTSEGWKVIQAVIDDFTEFKGLNRLKMGDPSEVY